MPVSPERRAEIARQNGAKSKGPTSEAGRERCRQAARRRSLPVSFDCTLLPLESRELLESITAEEIAYWQPTSPNEIQLVHELIDINWRIKRIRFTQTNALIENMEAQRQRQDAPEASVSMLARAEREGSTSTGEQLLLDRRVAALSTTRARILRDLERLARRFPNRAGSQSALETENLSFEISWKVPADPAEPAQEDILSWVEENATIEPDSAQTAILTAETPEITVATNAETTAGAIRAVYEAVQNPGATIACKSSGLMQRARDFARQLGLALTPPPPGAGGFTLPNGSQVVFDPGTVTPRLTVVHKQTPGWRVDCPEEGGGDVSPDIRPGR